MNSPLPPGAAVLAADQARQLRALAGTLDADQLQWASGFLAGYAAARGTGGAPVATAQDARLTILHGSQSGNSRRLAEQIAAQAREAGLSVRVAGMGDYKPAELRTETHLLVVVSTHGEGDPPDPALDLHDLLHGRKAPALPGLSFAVLALGDSSYEHFCKTGRDFDAVLEKLGGTRLHPRGELDVDYDDAARTWTAAALAAFGPALAARAPAPAATGAAPGASAQTWTRDAPFAASVLENLVLTGRGSDKETRHLELSLAGSGLVYTPGDALAVVPRNQGALVDELITLLGLSADAPVTVGKETLALSRALTEKLEITTLTPAFLSAWAQRSEARALRDLVADEDGQALSAYLASCHVVDLVTDYPLRGLPAQDFVSMLRRLPSRAYSIASSLAACPDEVHLTVATVRYTAHGRPRLGVASGHMAGLAPGATLDVFLQDNPDFRLPADGAVPIVMIGPGTGVAPFRAFVQERAATGASGDSWLFFGDRHMRTDFLYQAEWLRALKEGTLTRMDVAFSRDQAHKVYVQQRIRERGAELWAWLERGAHVYVCGDAAHMAGDVHQALAEVVATHGGRSNEQADEYLKDLRRARRYQRDVY